MRGGGKEEGCSTRVLHSTSNNLLVGTISPFQISPGHGILAPFREQRLISLLELGRGDGFPIPPPHEAQRSAVLISALPRSFAACSLGLLFSVPLILFFSCLHPSAGAVVSHGVSLRSWALAFNPTLSVIFHF